MSEGVAVIQITKSFGKVKAVDDVTFEVEKGEFVTLLGPSGCGKTTTLRIIGGLTKPDGGEIKILGKTVTHLPPWQRNCGFVFQSYALFPHMTVKDNIAYGLRMRKLRRSEIEKRVNSVARMLGIEDLLDRKPMQLSGGQQQRVAVARALAIEPDVLLMDEPLANLDAKLRERIRLEMRELQRQIAATTIYVTHDQEEAFSLSDRVAVMHSGKLHQIGSPEEILSNPASVFVASFVGRNNLLSGTITEIQGVEAHVDVGGVLIVGKLLGKVVIGEKVAVVFGAQDVEILHHAELAKHAAVNIISGTVEMVAFSGTGYTVLVKSAVGELRVELPYKEAQAQRIRAGDAVGVVIRNAKILKLAEGHEV